MAPTEEDPTITSCETPVLKPSREAEIGAQRAAPSSIAKIRASHAAFMLSAMGLSGVGEFVLRRAGLPASGNTFTPCDKCSKPTRGERCFKCRTNPAPGGGATK